MPASPPPISGLNQRGSVAVQGCCTPRPLSRTGLLHPFPPNVKSNIFLAHQDLDVELELQAAAAAQRSDVGSSSEGGGGGSRNGLAEYDEEEEEEEEDDGEAAAAQVSYPTVTKYVLCTCGLGR